MADSTPNTSRSPRSATSTAAIVSLHKIAQIAGSLATVVLVPRLLGAETYGRFAFVLALSYLGQILGDLGTLDVFGRFVPGMAAQAAQRLYMHTLALKLVVGVVCGALTAAAAMWWGDWMRLPWAIMAGVGVGLHIVAWVPFQFALGLNRVGAWMTEQAWRQWVMLLALLGLFPLLGFGGALLALLLMEALFCLLGLWWAREWWMPGGLRLDWREYRPFLLAGSGFFLANLAAVTLYRSGPVLVELLTGEVVQAGYIDLAIGLFLMAYVTVSQFAQSLIPTLGDLRARERIEESRRLLGAFMRAGLLVTVLGSAFIWVLADWGVPLVFGDDFGPVAASMKWISLGMPLAVLAWAGNVTATVAGRGRVKFGASLAALGVYLVVTLVLVPVWGAAGAALALSLAVLSHVAVLVIGLGNDFRLRTLLPLGRSA